MNRDNVIGFLLNALLAAVGAIVVGLVFFNRGIFDANRVGYQFLSFGIIGGILFSSFHFLRKWISGIIFLALLVLNEALLHLGNWDFIWQDVLYFVAMSAALFVFSEYYFRRLSTTLLSRLFALSSLFAIGYIIVTVVFYFIFTANPAVPRFNLSQMIYYDLAQGFLVGFGLGAGIEGAQFVIKKAMQGTIEVSDRDSADH